MTRKKATAVAEPETEQVEEQVEAPAVDVGHGEVPLADYDEPVAIPVALFKCTGHTDRFPDEEQFMLPLEAFPLKADGTRRGVYCRRCQGKLHTAYGQRKRAATLNSLDYLEAQITKKRAELAKLEEQLQVALDREDAK